MSIKELENRIIKIGKTSITVKDEKDKTCGIVRNICRFKNLQPNKVSVYFHKLKDIGVWGNVNLDEFIIVDNEMYVLRNMKSKLFYDKYGFPSNEEKQRYDMKEEIYKSLTNNGITVIPCIFG